MTIATTTKRGDSMNSGNGGVRYAVMIAAIIAAVAGPMMAIQGNAAMRMDRLESSTNARLVELDQQLQAEIATVEDRLDDRHTEQQQELFRLRDYTENIPALQAEIEVLKNEVVRLRSEINGK
jgi:chromosome segregation ATPase